MISVKVHCEGYIYLNINTHKVEVPSLVMHTLHSINHNFAPFLVVLIIYNVHSLIAAV